MIFKAALKELKVIFLLVIFLLPSGSAEAGLFGYSDQCECILNKMDGVHNDIAAGMIVLECRKEFSDKKCKSRTNSFFSMSFRECISKYGKNVSGEFAVNAVMGMCRRIYGK